MVKSDVLKSECKLSQIKDGVAECNQLIEKIKSIQICEICSELVCDNCSKEHKCDDESECRVCSKYNLQCSTNTNIFNLYIENIECIKKVYAVFKKLTEVECSSKEYDISPVFPSTKRDIAKYKTSHINDYLSYKVLLGNNEAGDEIRQTIIKYNNLIVLKCTFGSDYNYEYYVSDIIERFDQEEI